ncbi:MAG: type IV pilus modification protein PilV [Ectothiorhodospiraceae bacterium]|nr:type IV pilus modification protein PilV [Ectothiorhodospiraceae bacterium]
MSNLTQFKSTEFRRKNLRGFTLIEVLVTVVVVSIGLLGLAGLQINGLRANMSSEARSKATLLASDIVERMRANLAGVDANLYDGINISEATCAAPTPLCSNISGTPLTGGSCTSAQMATFDAWAWGCGLTPAGGAQRGGIVNRLPNAIASVACEDNNPDDAPLCSPGSPHTVSITWSEQNPSDGSATLQTISLVVVP